MNDKDTVAADAAAPSDTCACGYSLETSCNVLDPTCKRNAAQPDERAAFEAWAKEYYDEYTFQHGLDRRRCETDAWNGWQARATAPQATATEEVSIGGSVYIRAGGFKQFPDGRNLPVFIHEGHMDERESGAALTEDQIEAIYEECHDKWIASKKCINLWHTFARALLATQEQS